MQAEGWNNRDQVSIPEVNQLLLKVLPFTDHACVSADLEIYLQFSLLIIGRCGFGLPMAWSPEKLKDNELSYEESVRKAAETLMPRFILPSWAFKLPVQK